MAGVYRSLYAAKESAGFCRVERLEIFYSVIEARDLLVCRPYESITGGDTVDRGLSLCGDSDRRRIVPAGPCADSGSLVRPRTCRRFCTSLAVRLQVRRTHLELCRSAYGGASRDGLCLPATFRIVVRSTEPPGVYWSLTPIYRA